MKPSISFDAWGIIETALAPSKNPAPDRPTWDLIAEQERLRILDILSHRLQIYGVSNDKGSAST